MQRDLSTGHPEETLEHFDDQSSAVAAEFEDWEVVVNNGRSDATVESAV